jgi:hypothetical protein
MRSQPQKNMAFWQKSLANGNPLLELPIDKARA